MTIYEIGAKVELSVYLTGKYTYTTCFGATTIYKLVDADNKDRVFVWKTSTSLCKETVDADGKVKYDFVSKNDLATIKATIKAFSEYKGESQIELTRVKLLDVKHAITKEELEAQKKEEQISKLEDGDRIIKMGYKQYKEHYSDCETVAGSFVRYEDGYSDIQVIVKAGRMKASGVRYQHFAGYEVTNEEGTFITYRAVSEENAIRRADKEYPGHTWKCTKVYRYGRR